MIFHAIEAKDWPMSGQGVNGGLRTTAAVAAAALHTSTSLDVFWVAAIYTLYLLLILWADTPHQRQHR